MKNLTLLLILGTCLTFFACSKNNNDSENMPTLDQIFQLKISETAVFSDHDISVQAERVVEDSRCPVNVNCIVAGWVTVLFNVTVDDTEHTFQVTFDPSKPQDAEVETGGYVFRLVTVNPYPQDSNEIEQEDYSFSLVLEQ